MSEAEVHTLAEILKRVETNLVQVSRDIDDLKTWKNRAQGAVMVLLMLEGLITGLLLKKIGG